MRNDPNLKGYKIDAMEMILSLYADDCSIFLEYNADNLRYCLKIMNDFYLLSGLKMQVEKTQVIVIGIGNDPVENLCPELNLVWDQNFTLLGVNFDANLEKMHENFTEKMKDINQVISNWKYRLLTPLGRCCIAKTLLLSKLSNLSLVLPSLSPKMLKEIENVIYEFIWKGSEGRKASEKVARVDAKMHILQGGLGMPDIKASWMSFKLTWFRRIYSSTAKWRDIFDILLKKVDRKYSMENFFTLGTDDYNKISKKIESKFWSECLSVIKPFMRELLTQYPETIIKCTLWGSDAFTRNGNLCFKRNFPIIGQYILSPMDIIKIDNGETKFITSGEFQNKYANFDENEYLSLKYMITCALQKHNIQLARLETDAAQTPYAPAFVKLINLAQKGCNVWTRLIHKSRVTENTRQFEQRWETSLGNIQGVHFWNRCYRNASKIFFNAKLKWFYYQTVRGCLKTNRIVCKIKRNVQKECTFCGINTETIMHLFWECTLVKPFIMDCIQYAQTSMEPFYHNYSRNQFLFGLSEDICSPKNYYALHIRYYIWIQRCLKTILNINGFKNWLLREIRIDVNHNNDKKLVFLTDILNIDQNDDFVFI